MASRLHGVGALLSALAVTCGGQLGSGCGAVETSAPATTAADASADAAGDGGFGASACGECVATSCAAARRSCGAEPGCAAYLVCLDACALGSDGNVDPACEAACPRPSEPAAAQAFSAFDGCRRQGDGAVCDACGPRASYSSPLLEQACDGTVPPRSKPATLCPGDDLAALDRCRDCSYQRCCDSRAACDGDPECLAFSECMSACGSSTGRTQACVDQHPGGLVLFSPLVACVGVRCAPECDPAELDCGRCTRLRCADEATAYRGNPSFFRAEACREACAPNDSACPLDCLAKFPDLKAAFDTLSLCLLARCPSCGG